MTTDTALLVCREILEEGKNIKDLKFIEEPQIPTDNSVRRYLDLRFPLPEFVKTIKTLYEDKEYHPLKDLRKNLTIPGGDIE